MEEKTRLMKLKMNKYKQVAGSDSRLEQDYHKVKKKRRPDTVNVRFAAHRARSTSTDSILFAWLHWA